MTHGYSRSARAAELVMLGAISAAALVLLFEAARVGLWIDELPGPGLYPGALLVLIALLSVILGVDALRTRTQRPAEAASTTGRGRDVALVATSLLLIPFLLPLVGFRLLAFVYLLGIMVFLAPSITLAKTLGLSLLAGLIAVGAYAFFAAAFRIFLPLGRLTGL